MSSWMIDREVMSAAQLSLIDNTPIDPKLGLFVRGPAGSGKTNMALYFADKIFRNRVGSKIKVIVFTNILRDFIMAGLEDLGLPRDMVQTAYGWRASKTLNTDYLIVDEAQDFPINAEQARSAGKRSGNVSEWSQLASSGLILFGDFKQRIYPGMDWGLEDLKLAILPFKLQLKFLAQNFRMPVSIAKVASYLLPPTDGERLVSQAMNLDASAIVAHVSADDQNRKASWIKQVIENMGLTDVGILVPSNSLGSGIYDALKRVRVHCEAKLCYRQNATPIDFNSPIPKILTYHSAKGVQFETIFIPFGEVEVNNDALLLVAITRAKKNIFILHGGELCSQLRKIPDEVLPILD